MNLKNILRPRYLAGRLANWVYEKRHPDHPWLSPGAIQWLDQHLDRSMRGFEWGSGRSTCWLAARLSHLTSIEHDPSWFFQVKQMLEVAQLHHVELHHFSLEHPASETYENSYGVLPRYVSIIDGIPDASLDFVLVDGWYRSVCTQAALPKLKPGALLVIDNTDWQHPPHYHVPKDWELVHESRNVMTQTSIWLKPDN